MVVTYVAMLIGHSQGWAMTWPVAGNRQRASGGGGRNINGKNNKVYFELGQI